MHRIYGCMHWQLSQWPVESMGADTGNCPSGLYNPGVQPLAAVPRACRIQGCRHWQLSQWPVESRGACTGNCSKGLQNPGVQALATVPKACRIQECRHWQLFQGPVESRGPGLDELKTLSVCVHKSNQIKSLK